MNATRRNLQVATNHRAFAVRILAGCLVLTAVAFIQTPGYLVADTKFDLVENPVALLDRAFGLWDAEGAFGQLQNQAYGYFWPMGPFFVLGSLVGLPGWVVQRLWLAVVMAVAFTGTAKLSRALGVRSDFACLVAAFAFATSPRLLTTLGPISIEGWPSAMAPWVLLPLVVGSRQGSPRRAAAWSAVAVGMVGGVNAVATAAVIPLGVLWLLTRAWGRRSASMLLWWPLFTFVATAWWLVPLFILGTYSPPFLDFIETASITTFPTTVTDALRGTSAWVPYLDESWRGGRETITQGYLALNSGIVLMVGTIGLLMRRNPHRLFLSLGAVCGLLLVTFGHQGDVEGWFAPTLNGLLDTVLAPLRNVHKFDPVVRLPLVLGLAWFLEITARSSVPIAIPLRRRSLVVPSHTGYATMVVIAVLGASLPAISGRLLPSDPVLETPGYWRAANQWLAEHTEDGTTALLVPGSGFADYAWGAPRDEPLQYLAGSTWAIRNAIPLAPAGNIRMLDRIEQELQRGRGSSALTAYLRRAGLRFVVVRNDLASDVARPSSAQVHQSLGTSEGITRVAGFGPVTDDSVELESDQGRLVIDGGWRAAWNAVEVFEVQRATAAVAADSLPVVVGGPEDVFDVVRAGVTDDEVPVQLGYDRSEDHVPDQPVVLTDGFVDRERFFGRIHDSSSAATTPGDVRRTGNPTRDYLPVPAAGDVRRWQTRATLTGARSISASSSGSDATAFEGTLPGQLPFAAVDRDADTEWVSDLLRSQPAWWQISLEEPIEVEEVRVVVGSSAADGITVRARTGQGAGDAVDVTPGETITLPVPAGSTDWVRVEVTDQDTRRLALADVDWEDRPSVRRVLEVPELPRGWDVPDAVLLRTLLSGRGGCVVVDGRTPCLAEEVVPSEEPAGLDRIVTMPRTATFRSRAMARPVAGAELDALIQSDRLVNARVSSYGVEDARGGAFAAIDGDAGTSWTPAVSDLSPVLTLSWLGRRTISGLRVTVPSAAPVRRPSRVSVSWPGGSETVDLDDEGRADFPAVRTDQLAIRLDAGDNGQVIDTEGNRTPMPLGVSEVSLRGLDPQGPLGSEIRTFGCGTGPDLVVNGVSWRTALRTSTARVYAGARARLRACADDRFRTVPVSLLQGRNEIRSTRSPVAVLESLLLTRGAELPLSGRATTDLGAMDRPGEPMGRDIVAVMRHNANAGWSATQDGESLSPVLVDGWQQGWQLSGSGAVRETYGPGRPYRFALVTGLAAFALLVGCLVVSGRVRRARAPRRSVPIAAVSSRTAPVLVLIPAAVVASGLLAGAPGAIIGALTGTLGALLGRLGEDRYEPVPWLVGASVMVAVSAYFVRPWGDPTGWAGGLAWPHLMVVGVVAFCLVSAATRRPRRIPGSSTHR